MPKSNKQVINIEFECIELPAFICANYPQLRLGIQKKQEIKQDVPCTADSIHFHFPLEVTFEGDKVIFSGRYTQGPHDNRFVYLSWGEWKDELWTLHRRAKVMLNGIGRDRVEAAIQENKPIRARIKMTNAKGEPVAAALKSDSVEWL
jgi:hypothetical protein